MREAVWDDYVLWSAACLDHLDAHPEDVADVHEIPSEDIHVALAAAHGIDVEHFLLACLRGGLDRGMRALRQDREDAGHPDLQ